MNSIKRIHSLSLILCIFFFNTSKVNACVDSVSSAHTISANCSGSGDPIDVLTGADLTINSGVTVSNSLGSSREGDPIHVDSGSAKITNNGTIYTSLQYGITNYTTGVTIINSGSISSGFRRGIVNVEGSTIDILTNTGTISGPFSDILNEATATITTLNNLQGAGHSNGNLEIQVNLPVNYNIIVNSTSTYGKLTHKSGTSANTTTFGIHSSSSLSKGTYTGVLDKITSSELASTRSGTFGDYGWKLKLQSGDSDTWDLIIRSPYTSRITGKLSSILQVLETIDSNSSNSTLTSSLDDLSDTALEKAARQIKGVTIQKSIGQSVMSNNSFKRAMSSARPVSSNASLVRNNLADLTTADYLNFNGFNQSNFNMIDQNNFTFKDLTRIYKNKNLFSFGSFGNEMYLRTFGGITEQDKAGTSIGYSSTTAGFVFGSQNTFAPDLQAGWGLGFSTTGLDYDEGYGLNNTHSLHANFFTDKNYGSYKTNLSFGSFLSKNNSTRNITEGVTQTLKSSSYDLGFDIKMDLTKTFKVLGWEVSPLVSVSSSYVIQDDINETGGDLALDIKTDNLLQIKPEIGFSFDRNLSNTSLASKKISFSFFGSKEEKLDGSDARATIKDTGDGYALIDDQKTDKFLTSGLSYISINEINNSLLSFGAFFTQNEHGSMDSGLLSFNYQKKF